MSRRLEAERALALEREELDRQRREGESRRVREESRLAQERKLFEEQMAQLQAMRAEAAKVVAARKHLLDV